MQASHSTDHEQCGIVLVFAGGDAPTPTDRTRLPLRAMVIAADGGTDHALACGYDVDLVVGDLDSVSEAGLAAAVDSGATIERHAREKDASDLELALLRAVEHHPERIVVTALSGGRTDHFLANLVLCAGGRFAGVHIDVVSGSDELFVVRGRRSLEVEVGQLVTLLPVHGPANGVTTEGLRYPLDDETLDAGSSRGISNVAVATYVTIDVRDGVVLAIIPADAPR